ncbi:MAG: hydroxymethylbilane synthase [Bacteroidetes bacterium]|nr:hydroxymethylbilane synthase [Bacteroidota bacterium]
MQKEIIIGTRGSELALWQAYHVKAELEKLGQKVQLKIIKTSGDQIQNLSFDKMEGKGFFTKEIEAELLAKTIDLAVHSHKDLETDQPAGLKVACVSEREDPADILLILPQFFDPSKNLSLKEGAIVGTSSARRKAQLTAFRNDIEIRDLRGNVPTRIQKLRDGHYSAIVLAAAGVKRLQIDLSEFKVVRPDPREFVAAPAQGVLGLQIREDDLELEKVLQAMNSVNAAKEIAVERKVLNQLDGGCQLPLGVHCIKEGGMYKVWAALGNGKGVKRAYAENINHEILAEKILKKFKVESSKLKVFISKKINADSLFNQRFLGDNVEVIGESLIEFKGKEFSEIPKSNWIFFTSRNSAKYFFKQKLDISGRKIACVGSGTYQEVAKHTKQIDFVGNDVDINKVGVEFAKIVGGEKVLFPVSDITRGTVQKNFNAAQVIDFTTYETVERSDFSIPLCDVLVFTSPSSVRSFFKKHSIQSTQKVVAMGPSTGRELEVFGVVKYSLPKITGELGLVDEVLG